MENNKYDYKSVYATNFVELDEKVSKLLNEEYKLYGQPYFVSKWIIQTLVKSPIIEGEEDE